MSDILTIYLGGDGTPWIQGRYIARDPTPRNPLALKLFIQDPAPAAYIARPCYYVDAYREVNASRDNKANIDDNSDSDKRDCDDARWWTDARYSEPVLASMQSAMLNLQQALGFKQIRLVGYSGGGAIAALLTPRINASSLVTIAANLDIDEWTHHHGYLTLKSSLNPQSMPPSSATNAAIHMAGAKDRAVPARIVGAFVKKHGGLLWVYKKYNHGCCWARDWPSILKRIDAATSLNGQ